MQSNSQLVVVGDSYLNWLTHDFPNDLTRALGHEYRMYAEPGASMASGGIATLVPDQLATAIADDRNIIAGVMTGGGNDILLSDTELYPGSDECKDRADSPSLKVCHDVVAAALAAARTLINTAAEAGVRDVIYIYYPHIPGSLLGVFALSPNEILDYSMPMARDVCERAEAETHGKLRCRVFGGHVRFAQPATELQFPSTWLARTQLHSNPELHHLLKLQADRQLALQRSGTLSARVEQLLAAREPHTLPSMLEVARAR